MSLAVIDVSTVLDHQPVRGFHWIVYLLCGAVLFVEGLDTQAIGYVAPVLSKAWALKPGALGPAFAAGLLGLALGAFLIGPLADSLGRKPVVIVSTLLFGLLTLATVFVSTMPALLALRFVTGLGLGGAMPNAIALTGEYSAASRRSTTVAIMFCGFGIGSIAGGALSAMLLEGGNWQAVFLWGGVLTLILVPILMIFLPESVGFLALRGGHDQAVQRLLARVDPRYSGRADARFVHGKEGAKVPVGELFRGGRGLVTVLLWVVFFMNLLDLYLMASWLPTTITASGISVRNAVIATALLQVGGILGAFILGPLIDRFNAHRVLPPTYLLAAIFIGAIGFAGSSVPFTMGAVFLAGFAVVGSQNCNNGVAAKYYPTRMRATGIGWALAVGRIGSVVGPSLAGILLSFEANMRTLFLFSAVPALIAGACYVIMGTRAAALPAVAEI